MNDNKEEKINDKHWMQDEKEPGFDQPYHDVKIAL